MAWRWQAHLPSIINKIPLEKGRIENSNKESGCKLISKALVKSCFQLYRLLDRSTFHNLKPLFAPLSSIVHGGETIPPVFLPLAVEDGELTPLRET
jgi:hypothetical protein